MSTDGQGDSIRKTGGHIDNIVMALIEAVYDKNESVTRATCNSLFGIGKHRPQIVLSSCHSYLLKNPKLPLAHRILILGVMERVCGDAMDRIHKDLVVDVVTQSVEELVNTKEIVPEWQTAASGILVALGQKWMEAVMEHLLLKFQPGVLPHFFVVQTLANLAAANAFGMVPYLKATLGTMLPMLGMIKHDNMKWVFSYALSRFAEAVTEYLANLEKAPDASVTKVAFAGEMASAYDLLFGSWLGSRDHKVRAQVVQALGNMAHILSAEKVEELLPKVIPGILQLYRKNHDALPITEGLCTTLDAAIGNQSASLELLLDNILTVVFPQVCGLPDYSQPSGVKNHNEVLRCFAVLVSHPSPAYCERLVVFLLQRLENGNERIRIGALSVLKHLLNSCDGHISDKIPTLISTLKVTLSDPNNKVKKVLAQVIVALAHHGYLERLKSDERDMVEFIIRQCALPDEIQGRRPADPDYVSNEALRAMCENVLHLLTTTVERMEKVLWPYLFECLLPDDFSPAVGAICKSLSHLAAKKREEQSQDFEIGRQSGLPKPQELLARLVVLLVDPTKGANRGVSILRCLKTISPLVDKSLPPLWDITMPQLIQQLEETTASGEAWHQQSWEECVLELVKKTLNEVDREDWAVRLGKALLSQISLYVDHPEEKRMLLRVLGLVLRRSADKKFINQALESIFAGVHHSNPTEREGCAIAAGACGAIHLDAVLVKLEHIMKEEQKKNSGILAFIKDFRGDVEQDKVKATLVLSYGHLALNAPASILTTRIETPILRSILYFYNASKDQSVKLCMLQTLKLLARALHPEHLKETYVFASRNELLSLIQSVLKSETAAPLNTSVRSLALSAASSLLMLDPPLAQNEKSSLVSVSCQSVFPIVKEALLLSKREPEAPSSEEMPDYDNLLASTLSSLDGMLQQLLLKERTSENLDFVIRTMRPWLTSRSDMERERSIACVLHLLQVYIACHDVGMYSSFGALGSIMGCLVPRCTDPSVSVRTVALRSVDALLCIVNQSQYRSVDRDVVLLSVKELQRQAENDDASSLFLITKELAKIVSDRVMGDQLPTLLSALIEGLADVHSQSSSGVSVVLNGVVKQRGGDLRPEVPQLVEALQRQLAIIACYQTRTGTLRVIRSLASHHLVQVVTTLLASPLPYTKQVIDSWQVIAREPNLGHSVADHLLDILTDNSLTEHLQDSRKTINVASLHPLAAVSALKEIFMVVEMEQYAKDHFDRLFATFLLVVATYVGAFQPIDRDSGGSKDSALLNRLLLEKSSSKAMPVRCAVESFKSFLLCARQDSIISCVGETNSWTLLEDEELYPEAVAILASAVCKHWPTQVPKIVANLNGALNSPQEAQRVVSIALFAQFLPHTFESNQTLTEPLVNTLLGHLVDGSVVVRKLCIKGLGCMGSLQKDQVQRYSTTVLSAMMAGMDDKDDPESQITLEAMGGLTSVLARIDEADVREILINITLRIRPFFDKDKASVRSAAFLLLGNLSRFGAGPSLGAFVEQVHSNFVTLLLHLNDDDRDVVKSCKHALKLLGPLLGSESVNAMFQKYLPDNAQLHYGEFVNDLAKALIADFNEKCEIYVSSALPYLKSNQSTLQCNACVLLGFLLGNLPQEQRLGISKERVCGALIVMLKDPCTEVRMKAADALSLLHSY